MVDLIKKKGKVLNTLYIHNWALGINEQPLLIQVKKLRMCKKYIYIYIYTHTHTSNCTHAKHVLIKIWKIKFTKRENIKWSLNLFGDDLQTIFRR